MLAAAPPEREIYPSLLHLALEILSADGQLPTQLSAHLTSVFDQASVIVKSPNSVDEHTHPEAIELALEAAQSAKLMAVLNQGWDPKMTSEAAKELLALERRHASAT